MTDEERRFACLAGCTCIMCAKIREYRAKTPDYAHRADCGCSRCSRVEDLAKAREAGARQAENDKAFKYGYDKARDE